MTNDELNAEIARLRGWTRGPHGWRPLAPAPAWESAAYDAQAPAPLDDAPDFCGSWALAGPLLEEMATGCNPPELGCGVVYAYDSWTGGEAWVAGEGAAGVDEFGLAGVVKGATPTEAIARAWLAWRRASLQPPGPLG